MPVAAILPGANLVRVRLEGAFVSHVSNLRMAATKIADQVCRAVAVVLAKCAQGAEWQQHDCCAHNRGIGDAIPFSISGLLPSAFFSRDFALAVCFGITLATREADLVP
jgi:hypothetical protein